MRKSWEIKFLNIAINIVIHYSNNHTGKKVYDYGIILVYVQTNLFFLFDLSGVYVFCPDANCILAF